MSFVSREKNSDGNAMLETVMFIPLALFFLFVVIDSGLSLIQRASIQDDFRSAIHSTAAYVKTISSNNILEFNDTQLESLAGNIANELFSNVSSSFGVLPDAENSLFAVSVTAFELTVASDGKAGSLRQVGNSELPVFGLSQVAAKVPSTQFTTMQEFIDAELEQDSLNAVSKYAHPVGYIHSAEGGSVDEYKNRSILIYVEVRAVPKGLNLAFVGQTFGRFFSIHQQSLRSVRLQ